MEDYQSAKEAQMRTISTSMTPFGNKAVNAIIVETIAERPVVITEQSTSNKTSQTHHQPDHVSYTQS